MKPPVAQTLWQVNAVLFFLLWKTAHAITPCRIEVVEKGTGWPVPLVSLQTVSKVTFVTDNAGLIAFDLPECMNRETWFMVSGHGYEVPKDGLGNRGVRLTPTEHGKLKIEVQRVNIAKRLGRLTGSGIFGESQKLGERMDWVESGVVGQDTVEISPYKGKLYWAWGDTDVFSYPLGFFNTSSATTSLHPLASFEPPLALSYDYFRDEKGTPHGVVDIKHSGPIWVSAYVTFLDKKEQEHLVCTYTKIEHSLEPVEIGLAEWDDASSSLKQVQMIWKKDSNNKNAKPLFPIGHSSFWTDASGKKWVYFGEGLPNMRCPATYEDWKNPSTWEAVERPLSLVSAADGKEVSIAAGSIAWNAWRKRWVTVFEQKFGTPSFLGELWYAEADSPAGPWGPAVKVLTHDNYTFYNPLLHPELTPSDSPILLFEGTYTATFADHPVKTPRYDYNQILYRLDLDDPALKAAQANK